MNSDLNEELERIDESYKNSFEKIGEINDVSQSMNDVWGNDAYNDFAKKMKNFTEDMVKLQNCFDEYESSVSEITTVSDKLEDVYGKKK